MSSYDRRRRKADMRRGEPGDDEPPTAAVRDVRFWAERARDRAGRGR